MAAILGYENLLESGTVTASSVNAAFPIANLYDWRTSDFFKPAASGTINIDLVLIGARAADYFAFYGHDLHKHGGSIKLQYWNGTAFVDCFSAVTPTDGTPRLIPFPSKTASSWRIVITCTSVFSMAVASFGASLAMERGLYIGWTPPKYGRATELIDSTSDGGEFLGRSIISKGVKSTLEVNRGSEAWMETNWLAFVRHAELKPFFFLPNPVTKPSDSVFAWTDGDIPVATYTAKGFMSVSVPIRGMVE